jgi:hypothetical protein
MTIQELVNRAIITNGFSFKWKRRCHRVKEITFLPTYDNGKSELYCKVMGGAWAKNEKKSKDWFEFGYHFVPAKYSEKIFLHKITDEITLDGGKGKIKLELDLKKLGINSNGNDIAILLDGFQIKTNEPYINGATITSLGAWTTPAKIYSNNKKVSFNVEMELIGKTAKKLKKKRYIGDDYSCTGKVAYTIVWAKGGSVTTFENEGKPKLIGELPYKSEMDNEFCLNLQKKSKPDSTFVGLSGFHFVWDNKSGLYVSEMDHHIHDVFQDKENDEIHLKVMAKMWNARKAPFRQKIGVDIKGSYSLIELPEKITIGPKYHVSANVPAGDECECKLV